VPYTGYGPLFVHYSLGRKVPWSRLSVLAATAGRRQSRTTAKEVAVAGPAQAVMPEGGEVRVHSRTCLLAEEAPRHIRMQQVVDVCGGSLRLWVHLW